MINTAGALSRIEPGEPLVRPSRTDWQDSTTSEVRDFTWSAPLSFEAEMRLASVNRYFQIKAAEAFMDKVAVKMLAKLYEMEAIRYQELEIDSYGIALSKLAAAGFCELESSRARISKAGREFLTGMAE